MSIKSEKIELVDVQSLVPYEKNMNSHTEEQIKRLCELIKYQGFRDPIIAQKGTNVIAAGHCRLEAAKRLGFKKVPVIYQEFDNEAQFYAFVVSHNAIASWSELDLDEINKEILEFEDFDLELLGIEDFKAIEPEVTPLCDEDDVPDVIEPITKRGDIWILGNHRLMCGDSTMIDDVEKLMNGEKADMVFTDPPYNVAFNGRSGKHDVIKNDDMEDCEFDNFISEVLQVIKTIKPKHYYIWCNWKFYATLQRELEYKACIVWAKNVFGLGSNYRHQHEFCLFNGSLDADIKNESDLWQVKKDHNYVHPTQKPVELSERALGNHKTEKNILDLFGGSGSTLVGCEKMKRNCYIMELDLKYCDVIINRWQNFTGKKAVLESNGKTYDELKNG